MSTSKTLRVALAQTCPLNSKLSYPAGEKDPFETLRANLADCADFVKRAKEGGAKVVCFAEYYLQGILNEGRRYLSLPSRYMEECIADLARKYEIAITGTIVHGTSTSLPSIPEVNPFAENSDEATKKWSQYFQQIQPEMTNTDHLTLLNEAFFYDSTGKRRGTYVKKNLWHPERDYLNPGQEHYPVFDTPWGKAGFLICWDLSHPTAAQDLVRQGADIIFAPAYWLGIDSEPMASKHTKDQDYELKLVQALCWSRSFETETILIHVNPGGDRKKGGFMGGSGIWAPLKGKIGGYEREEVGVEFVDVELGVLNDGRDLYKIRDDADRRSGDARTKDSDESRCLSSKISL